MTIGIDGRLIGETGVGRYIRNLVRELSGIDNDNRYVIFLRNDTYRSFSLPNERWEKRLVDIPWHSLREQFALPTIFNKEKFDVLHIPYFNVPVFYFRPFIVTIHDLTILHFSTGKATMLPFPLYWIKRFGYSVSLWSSIVRAKRIITVSETIKKEIIAHFHVPSEKIVVTYEGIDVNISASSHQQSAEKRIIKDPYFLYVGNVYPHKNLEILLQAFRLASQGETLRGKKLTDDIKLVLVGKEDFFYSRLKQKVTSDGLLHARVQFFGQATDEQLYVLYKQAIALVFPSLMEGFGLPAIEALSLGCPVICSDIPVFHELLKDLPLYFCATNAEELHLKMMAVLLEHNNKIDYRNELRKKSLFQFHDYTWRKLAEATLSEYSKIYS